MKFLVYNTCWRSTAVSLDLFCNASSISTFLLHFFLSSLVLSCNNQLQRRKQIAESLREMNRENVAKLAAREKQKLIDAEEDKRLMKEYQERLDRRERKRGP